MADDYDIDGLLNQSQSLPSGREVVDPKDETFHSIYIAGQDRVNEEGVTEKSGKLQIRGFRYNLERIYGIIMHVKSVKVNTEMIEGQESLKCFSYQNSFPYRGTSGNICPKNSRMRASVPYCRDCRDHLIVSMILVNENGAPIKNEEKDNSLIYTFIRGKGTKYADVSEYLNALYNETFEVSILSSDRIKEEKAVINNKRVITCISIGERNSKFGVKKVFKLTRGKALSPDTTKKILEISTKMVSDFNKKFDWSQDIPIVQTNKEETQEDINSEPTTVDMPFEEPSPQENDDITDEFIL